MRLLAGFGATGYPSGPLHRRGADGRCEVCGEPAPCAARLATYEALKRELEDPRPSDLHETRLVYSHMR